MKTLEPSTSNQSTHLLDAVKSIWSTVGDALNDNDLTQFLATAGLPAEAGFTFLSYSHGCVTLTVPKQNPDDWYSETGSVAPEKEKIARAIAKKHGLWLSEPIDGPSNFYAQFGSRVVYHHLALADPHQTVVVIHPLFLKICLLGRSAEHSYGKEPHFPLPLSPDLLNDISSLYTHNLKSPGLAENGVEAIHQP